MEESKMNETIKEKQNSFSFRWGGTGTDMKLYFDDAKDLELQLNELRIRAPDLRLKLDAIKEALSQ
jgi:hypothetical protein